MVSSYEVVKLFDVLSVEQFKMTRMKEYGRMYFVGVVLVKTNDQDQEMLDD